MVLGAHANGMRRIDGTDMAIGAVIEKHDSVADRKEVRHNQFGSADRPSSKADPTEMRST